jgi:hypothetical protein
MPNVPRDRPQGAFSLYVLEALNGWAAPSPWGYGRGPRSAFGHNACPHGVISGADFGPPTPCNTMWSVGGHDDAKFVVGSVTGQMKRKPLGFGEGIGGNACEKIELCIEPPHINGDRRAAPVTYCHLGLEGGVIVIRPRAGVTRIKALQTEFCRRWLCLAAMGTFQDAARVNKAPFQLQRNQDHQSAQIGPEQAHPAHQALRHRLAGELGSQVQIIARGHSRDKVLRCRNQKCTRGERVHTHKHDPSYRGGG